MLEFLKSLPPHTYVVLALVVFSVTLLTRSRKYFQKKTQSLPLTPEQAAGIVVKPGERPRVLTVHTPGHGIAQTVVKTASHNTMFTGSSLPPEFAKWEIEIHELGRQTVARINTKLAAMQALVTEANRVSRQVETMIEHLEELLNARNGAAAATPRSAVPRSVTVGEIVDATVDETVDETVAHQKNAPDIPAHAAFPSGSSIMPAGVLEERTLEPLDNLLKEFEHERTRFESELSEMSEASGVSEIARMQGESVLSPENAQNTQNAHSSPGSSNRKHVDYSRSAKILEPHSPASTRLLSPPPHVESAMPLPEFPASAFPAPEFSVPDKKADGIGDLHSRHSESNDSKGIESRLTRRPIADSAATLPLPMQQPVRHQVPSSRQVEGPSLLHFPSGSAKPEKRIGNEKMRDTPAVSFSNGSSLSPKANLPNDDAPPQFASLFAQGTRTPSIVAGPKSSATSSGTTAPESGTSPRRFDLQQQVLMLTDYGYSPKEIAAQLNRTPGEIELIVNLRQQT